MSKPSILIIIIDTMRRDALIKYRRHLTKRGFKLFEKTIVPSPWTSPSHASMFTGLYPLAHGVHVKPITTERDINWYRIGVAYRDLMLHTKLKKKGYRTHLYSANPYITPYFGYKGFDHTIIVDALKRLDWCRITHRSDQKFKKLRSKTLLKTVLNMIKQSEHRLHLQIICNKLVEKLIFSNKILRKPYYAIRNWPKDKGASEIAARLRKAQLKSPFFMFINLMEVHDPYLINDTIYNDIIRNLATGRLDLHKVAEWRKKYYQFAHYSVKKLNQMLVTLEEKNAYDNTLIIVTSDHGQLLGEHGKIGHGTHLHSELLHVPMFVKPPANVRISEAPSGSQTSITAIKDFALRASENHVDENLLVSNTAFSESFGILEKIYSSIDVDVDRINYLNKLRLAIYRDGYKIIFNVTDWKIEETLDENDKKISINGQVADEAVKIAIKHLERNLKLRKSLQLPDAIRRR